MDDDDDGQRGLDSAQQGRRIGGIAGLAEQQQQHWRRFLFGKVPGGWKGGKDYWGMGGIQITGKGHFHQKQCANASRGQHNPIRDRARG